MKYISFTFLIIVLSFGLSAQENEFDQESNQLLMEPIASKSIVGISAGVMVNGKVEWKNSFGFSSRDEEIAFTDTTLTRMASIAKPMTAIAVMQLIEQGKLELDKTIGTYLEDYQNHDQGLITVKQLLSHTSGIAGYSSGKDAESKTEYANLFEANHAFKDNDLLFEPGTDYNYTTFGYVILGRLIEATSGMSYGDYMKANIFDKARMEHTGIEEFGKLYENKSSLYHRSKRKAKKAKQNNLSSRVPGGGFYTTLADVLRFGNAVLENELISAESMELMTTAQYIREDGNPYGFGWFLYNAAPNYGALFGHSGEQTGCANQILIKPESKTVSVVMSNTSGTWKEVIAMTANLMNVSYERNN